MRLITADECGLLKEVIPEYTRESENDQIKESGIRRITPDKEQQTRANGIVSLAFVSSEESSVDDDPSFSFAALRTNGSVEIWGSNEVMDTTTNGKIPRGNPVLNYGRAKVLNNVFLDENDDEKINSYTAKPLGIHSLKNRLTCCDSSGTMSIISCPDGGDAKVAANYDLYPKKADINQNNKRDIGMATKTNMLTAFALSDSGRAAVGGRERETTIFDVETGKQVWKAKNLPPDPQTLLQEPVWSTAIQFLSNDSFPSTVKKFANGSNSSTICDDLVLVGTAYKQMKVYDIRTQRRPILYTTGGVLDYRITALCQMNQNQVVVGDSAGYMHMMDFRKIKDPVGRYVGPSGSVKQILKHPTLPVLACVGLDRMLRTYDINTRKSIDKIYLKQRLNSFLFCMDGAIKTGKVGGSSGDADDEAPSEDAWKAIAESGDINEEDDVQDYVDSDEGGEDENDADATNSSSDSSMIDVSDSDEDSEDDDDEEEERQNSITKKKRRKR